MTYPIAQLQDLFTDNTIGPLWSTVIAGSGAVAETSGQARCTLPSSTAGSHDAYYRSTGTYDLTGTACTWNIDTMVATGVAATAYLQLLSTGVGQLLWRQVSNTLTARHVVGAVDTQVYSATWNATTYKYLRIRESGGTVYWESSSNSTSWTTRHSMAAPIAVTSLAVQFGCSCGNVASPGSLRIEELNATYPAPSSTWRETTADWSITNRLRPVTLASDGGKLGVLVTADTMDEGTRALGGTVRYFAGPLGSSSGGFLQLTEYASLAAAQASPFPIPVDGRVDLPAMVDARYMRLYHRSADASAHTIYEFVPRRIVQADDIEAESIRAINISAGAVTADKIFVLDLSAITATIGQLTIASSQGLDAWLYQGTGTGDSPTTGLKIFNSGGIGKLSTYNTGVEQVTLDTDGILKAGAGAVRLDVNGVSMKVNVSGTYSAPGALSWYDSTYATVENYIWSDSQAGTQALNMVSKRNAGGTKYGSIKLTGTGVTADAEIIMNGALSGGAFISLNASDIRLLGGVNVGTATSAATGEIRASGALHMPRSSGAAVFAIDGTSQGSAISIANNGTATPFGASRVFSGMILLSETAVTGSAAIFLVDGGGTVNMVSATANFSAAAGTAAKVNVYISGSAVTIENKLGSTASLNVVAIRSRTT